MSATNLQVLQRKIFDGNLSLEMDRVLLINALADLFEAIEKLKSLGIFIPVTEPQEPAEPGSGTSTITLDSIVMSDIAPPLTPVDGQIWRQNNTNAGLKIRVNGVTKTIVLS